MIYDLYEVAEDCIRLMRESQELSLSSDEEKRFKRCKECHTCNRKFTEMDFKVRDHDH